MISIDNDPLINQESNDDFVVENYRILVKSALKSYKPSGYKNIPWGERFILWRHDCDYSLNRAYALAKIECEEGLKATYFINPHCEFYNALEGTQAGLIKKILNLGHDIGVHFDGAFFNTTSEFQLNKQVKIDADLLENYFGIRPTAFSFHNPTSFHLSCEDGYYGGLVNCYSRQFKKEVPYCSDSNGYWRFRRLSDVLENASDRCLQVLTHPGWWQEKAMPPRQRIFRAVYGRAKKNMQLYDETLEASGRNNFSGVLEKIAFLRAECMELYEYFDYLSNIGQINILLSEMIVLYQFQLNEIGATSGLSGEILNYDYEVLCFHDLNEIPNLNFSNLNQTRVVMIDNQSLELIINISNRIITIKDNDESKLIKLISFLSKIIEINSDWGKFTNSSNGLSDFIRRAI